jgi:hypothetical protein
MKKFWAVLVALWRIAIWWNAKETVKAEKREELKKGVADAIKNKDHKSLDRMLSDL